MRASLRLKRTLAMAATGALVLTLLPGAALADTVEFDDVCEGAEDATFPDIGSTHADAISCMTAYGVIEGRTDGTFGTQVNIQRQQFASLIARFALVANPGLADAIDTSDAGFTDLVSATHSPNVNALANLGLVQGTTATTFSPNAPLTRAQAATIFVNAHEALGVEFDEDATSTFTDLGATHEDAINKLVDAGIVEGYDDTTFGYSDPIQRGQIASLLARSAAVLDSLGLWEGDLDDAPTPIGPNLTFTNAPELVNAEKGSSNIVRFNFDKAVPGIEAQPGNFLLYNPDAEAATPTELSISGSTVIARYQPQAFAQSVRAGVRTGAVADATGLLSIAGDFPLTASAVQASAITPDLISVGNYRFADDISLGTQRVLVDFVFADTTPATVPTVANAIVAAGEVENSFSLVGANSQRFNALDETPLVDATVAGQTTVTVAFAADPTDVPQSQLRRGVFQTAQVVGSPITWSSNFGATGGTTVDPDLISVTREGNTNIFRFTFDEAVSAAVGELTAAEAAQFTLVTQGFATTSGTTATRSAQEADGASVVRVQFGDLDTELDGVLPVHAFVTEDAVLATDSTDSDNAGRNRAAAQPITIPVIGDPEPGVTAALDLVSAERFQNEVTGQFSFRLTFDQEADVAAVAAAAGNYEWNLYDAAGVRFQVNPAMSPAGSIGAANVGGQLVITISSAAAGVSDDQIEASVTASVQQLTPAVGNGVTVSMTEGQVDARTLSQN